MFYVLVYIRVFHEFVFLYMYVCFMCVTCRAVLVCMCFMYVHLCAKMFYCLSTKLSYLTVCVDYKIWLWRK